MTTIRQVGRHEAELVDGLARLLIDSVDHGASVGFLAPLNAETACTYWQDVLAALGTGHNPGLLLWVAEREGAVLGSVQLALCQRENGRHRAEVQKLFVRSDFRERGIASQLLNTLEQAARAHGRSLLVLDTQAGSAAEALYRRRDWRRLGEIPGYAADPQGELHPTAYYFKTLTAPGGASA